MTVNRVKRYIKPTFIALIIMVFALYSSAIPIFKHAPILTYVVLMLASAYFWRSVLNARDQKSNEEKIDD